MLSWLALAGAIAATWVVVPAVSLAICSLNLVLSAVIAGMHLFEQARVRRLRDSGALVPSPPMRPNSASLPFVSVHVPTHDEPAHIVIETIRSLVALDYPAFEIIVLDNNTPDEATYAPVETFCESVALPAGVRLRFFHFDKVQGAKAGALNLCLNLTSDKADIVSIVDADYAVEPGFLRRAVEAMAHRSAGFVQFPQAYRSSTRNGTAVAVELDDYFYSFARTANATRSMLLTGTLSVIRVDVLCAAGGWNGGTLTEDAALGTAFFANGVKGVFVDEVMGRGLLPMSLGGLRAQRSRWVAGNIQTLMGLLRMTPHVARREGFVSILSQLTAWPTFWLVPAIVFLCASALPLDGRWRSEAVFVSSVTVLLSIVVHVVRLCARIDIGTLTIRDALLSSVVRLSLIWTTSAAWMWAVGGRSLPFVRTPKAPQAGGRLHLDPAVPACILGLACAIHYLLMKDYLATVACSFIFRDRPRRALHRLVAPCLCQNNQC